METNKPTLQQEVFEALGQASMCWSEIPTGVFQSEDAIEVGNQLMTKIEAEIKSKVQEANKPLLDALKEVGLYFMFHDKTMAEHRMYAIVDRAIKKATK